MLTDERRTHSPQSVTRVIQILQALCASPAPLGLRDLSRALDTPKSSMASLLRGLAAKDLIVSTAEGFRLGSAAFGLAAALLQARQRIQSSDLVRDGMRKLAELTNETIVFGVLDEADYMMTYLDVIESKSAVRYAVNVGDRRPLYSSAGGRALLSAQPDAYVREYLRKLKPKKLTTETELSKRRLADAIALTRQTGVARTINQGAEGAAGIGAPVYDSSGTAMGAVVVIMPSSRLSDKEAWLEQLVAEETAKISASLGYKPAPSS